MNKCPKCEKLINAVNITDLDGRVGMQSRWRCIGYTCPLCSTLLSVQIDPVSLKTDTVREVLQALGRTP